MNNLILAHPHPASPVKGEEFSCPPPRKELGIFDWREGLREGDKMAFFVSKVSCTVEN